MILEGYAKKMPIFWSWCDIYILMCCGPDLYRICHHWTSIPLAVIAQYMDRRSNDWQDTGAVLRLFGEKVSAARRQYRGHVEKGIALGKRCDLIGGGLIRSNGGWANRELWNRLKK